MEERTLVIGGFYKHFKDKLYQVRGIAYHSETKEKMVVYQALYGDYSMYVRPYDMFLSEVDHEKYPEVTQRYRFEEVTLSGSMMPQNIAQKQSVSAESVAPETQKVPCSNEAMQRKEQPIQDDLNNEEDTENAESVDARLMQFLDAESFDAKLDVLSLLRNQLDDKLIDAMAVSLDVEVPEGTIDSRYLSLKKCLQAHAKYEGLRLR